LLFEFFTDFCLGAGNSGTASTTIAGDCGATTDGAPFAVDPDPVAVAVAIAVAVAVPE